MTSLAEAIQDGEYTIETYQLNTGKWAHSVYKNGKLYCGSFDAGCDSQAEATETAKFFIESFTRRDDV